MINRDMIRAFARKTDCQESKSVLGNPLFEFTTSELCEVTEMIIKECADECTLAQDSKAIYAKFGLWEKV